MYARVCVSVYIDIAWWISKPRLVTCELSTGPEFTVQNAGMCVCDSAICSPSASLVFKLQLPIVLLFFFVVGISFVVIVIVVHMPSVITSDRRVENDNRSGMAAGPYDASGEGQAPRSDSPGLQWACEYGSGSDSDAERPDPDLVLGRPGQPAVPQPLTRAPHQLRHAHQSGGGPGGGDRR